MAAQSFDISATSQFFVIYKCGEFALYPTIRGFDEGAKQYQAHCSLQEYTADELSPAGLRAWAHLVSQC